MARRGMFWLVALTATLVACGGGTGLGAGGGQGPGSGQGSGSSQGSGGGNGGNAVPSDVCSLLTIPEAIGAMQLPGKTTLTTESGRNTCTWTEADNGNKPLVVTLYPDNAKNFPTTVEDGQTEFVNGIGDKAIWGISEWKLRFLVGKLEVWVFTANIGEMERTRAAQIAIGKIIAARLTTGSVPAELEITPAPVVNAGAACDLISAAEAAAIFGKGPMTVRSTEGQAQLCAYTLDSTGEDLLQVSLKPARGAEAWDETASYITADPVTGIGDKALFEAGGNRLYVLRGDAMFTITLPAFGLDPSPLALEQATKLAKVMLSHL